MMKKTFWAIIALILTFSTSCDNSYKKNAENQQVTTPVTDENYALAESQIIFNEYVKKIAADTHTEGTGIFMHNRQAPDPKDTTVVRINFDTRYSYAIVDLTHEATLVMPETNGRYQSAWLITEEHYNPMGITRPGTYKINQENAGCKYVMVAIRTQVNMKDAADMEAVTELQDKVQLIQEDKGSYSPSHQWDMNEILAMRQKYQKITIDKNITVDMMFGKKGEVPLEAHNCGVAFGWGGMTKDQAIYLNYVPEDENPCTLSLKDVPVAENAFWSITVYDKFGFPHEEPFNINSRFVKKNVDGTAVIHFGGNPSADNYIHIYKGWNFILRMYLPQAAYFDGTWQQPELKKA